MSAATLSVTDGPPIVAVPAPVLQRERQAPAWMLVRKCRGADGVPVFTHHACPADATLVSETRIEIPPDAPACGSTPTPAVAVANASATVIQQGAD